MRRHRLTVLKFGSSVLTSEADLPRAVHEIYRWVRAGSRVIAVVSAIGDTTDYLLAQTKKYGATIGDEAIAALLATGENSATAMLGLALDQAGVPYSILDEVQMGLKTTGSVLESEPCGLDCEAILEHLDRISVAVVPGFLGRRMDGVRSLLGRGGSDLTAIYIAHQLQADRCRLVKDVDGIYEFDPAISTKEPRRFQQLSWAEARVLGGGVVQAKTIDYAEQHHLSFEVAALHSETPTQVGPNLSSFYPAGTKRKRIRVGLLGAGTVGLGVYRALAANSEAFEITKIAVRRLERNDGIPRELLTTDVWDVVRSECDVLIELIGGEVLAARAIEAALARGKHVVTANKLVIAHHGPHLTKIAEAWGTRLYYSAAVGGAAPMLEQVTRIAEGEGVGSLEGVINGTTNYVLERIAEGSSPEEAVAQAQQLGFAEQDPTADLDGRDAAHKLALLTKAAFGTWVQPVDIQMAGIKEIEPLAVRDAYRSGYAYRLVASLTRTPKGVEAKVAPRCVSLDHPLAKTQNEDNCLEIRSTNQTITHVYGKGAGRWPTTESVIADLFDVYREEEIRVKAEQYLVGREA